MGTWGQAFNKRYNQPLSKKELKDLKEILEIGDPLKDFYDEQTVIDRLILTVEHGVGTVLEHE